MYNANNQLIAVTDWNNRITSYEYDNNGRLISESRPNGTYQTYTYNNAGQLTYTVDKTTDGKIINEYSYEYDADGNIITEDSINEPNYDNITIPSSEKNYGSANRLIDFNGIAISYDNDGNMLNTPLGNKWGILTYDSRNMLTDIVTSSGAIEYEYDAENNRTLKTEYSKTTSYVVNPNASLSQVLTSTKDGETTYYIYGLGLISEEKADTYKTYHYDYRGSTTAITDTNGNVTDRVYYDPYGSIVNRTGITNTPFLYVGKYGVETDDNGLYYMRARYYNPIIQRFVNVDPIRDGLNWYGYANGNSINNIDPYGKYSDYDIIQIQKAVLEDYINEQYRAFRYELETLPDKIVKSTQEAWDACSEIAFDYIFPYDDPEKYTQEPYLESDGLYATPLDEIFSFNVSDSISIGKNVETNLKNKKDENSISNFLGVTFVNQEGYLAKMMRTDYANDFSFHLYHENINVNTSINSRQSLGVDGSINFMDFNYARKNDIFDTGLFIKPGFIIGLGSIGAGCGYYIGQGLKIRSGMGIVPGFSLGFGRRYKDNANENDRNRK